jgi:GR25 family glycosyltransferase involved in LPS biosynthesis
MKTYIITLERAYDRQAKCRERYDNFEFFYGVDGNPLNEELRMMPTFKPGEVGCFKSHRDLWLKILMDSTNDNFVLILEDDAKPHIGYKKHLNDVVEELKKQEHSNIGICWLHGNKPTGFYRKMAGRFGNIFSEPIDDKPLGEHINKAGGRLNATSYLIRPSTAKELFYRMSPMLIPFDCQIHLPNNRKDIGHAVSKKPVFSQNPSQLPSYIHQKT